MNLATATEMDLHTLFKGLGAEAPVRDVVDITTDSRLAVRDGLFLACRGGRRHGLDFVGEALAAGVGAVAWEPDETLQAPVLPPAVTAVAVPRLRESLGALANRFFESPSLGLAVTGITGTNGKTTTAWLVAAAIGRLGAPAGYIGTLGHGLAGNLAANPSGLTTPDCITLHRQLRQLGDAGAGHVIAEVSSHALDQDRIAGVRFATVAFTNLTRDHLDYHTDLAAYGAVKARLFQTSAANAVINLDDPFGRQLAKQLPAGTQLLGVSLQGEAGASLRGTIATADRDGLVLALDGAFGRAELRSSLWGGFNAENLLLATGILLAAGWDLPAIAPALAACDGPPGRLQRVGGGPDTPVVVVDFAHTPDALRKALAAVREHNAGDVWCVFGCGGDRDRGKRAPMGTAAFSGADRTILTDDNPRTEDPQQIITDIIKGFPAVDRLQVVPDRAAAIGRAIQLARPGDVVLIAGKGHESVQITATATRSFSDADVARAALAARTLARPAPDPDA